MSAAASADLLSPRAAVLVFLVFAFTYFLSALVRAITATLSPTLSAAFELTSGDLGLLAGGYFFGFALTQLPLGNWLDRHGPKRVVLAFLGLAVLAQVPQRRLQAELHRRVGGEQRTEPRESFADLQTPFIPVPRLLLAAQQRQPLVAHQPGQVPDRLDPARHRLRVRPLLDLVPVDLFRRQGGWQFGHREADLSDDQELAELVPAAHLAAAVVPTAVSPRKRMSSEEEPTSTSKMPGSTRKS